MGQAALSQIGFPLRPVPPFRLDLTVWTLRRRPDNAVDRWDGQTYRRVLSLDSRVVEVAVGQTRPPEMPRLQIAAVRWSDRVRWTDFERGNGLALWRQACHEGGINMAEIRLKRAYEKPASDDGLRVLVERLWPRGLSKEQAAVDLWMKDVAPSPELRRWFNHDPARWDEFQRRYRAELRQKKDVVEELRQKCRGGTVTFVYAARDEEHNGALVLKDYLEHHDT